MTADLAPTPSVVSGASVSNVKSSTSTTSQTSYPRGHLGHLSDTQAAALVKFKDVCEEKGIWKRGPPASIDDQTLLRYLRARRWVVSDAYQQLKDTEDWRAANGLDILYRTIDLEAYEQSRRLYPQWTGRRDRRGTPLYVFEIRHLDSKTMAEYERQGKRPFSEAKTDGKTPPGLMRLFALYENLTRFAQPFCTQLTDREHPDVPITMSTNIVDISGVGLKQFWNLKSHMQAASQIATAHYPETLDRIFIIGAPVFFGTVWGWIKRWFDPITVSKIHILAAHEVKGALEVFVDVRNIPKKYGGELDYAWGQLSVADPEWEGVVAWENGHSSFPSGPLVWEETEDGSRLVCLALGKEKGVERKERICSVPKIWPQTSGKQTNGEQEQTNGDTAATATPIPIPTDAVTNGHAVEQLTLEGDATPTPSAEATTKTAA